MMISSTMPLPTTATVALLSSSPSPSPLAPPATASSSHSSSVPSLPHKLPPLPLSLSSRAFSLRQPSLSFTTVTRHWSTPSRLIACCVALKSDSDVGPSSSGEIEGISAEEEEELKLNTAKEGARVRVKVPLKVYHVPKIPEVDLTGMEGVVKQFVCLWKGKRISANMPFKVEFKINVEGRGLVKFFAHLKEEEIEFM